jgi:periplasmic divalent cation tolerance protein
MREFIQVSTAIDSMESAQKIAEALVSKRLAACVHVSGPITSTYWWQREENCTMLWNKPFEQFIRTKFQK